ncbi:MAG: UvrD-helicase domain-containing protein [Gemmataceae bacterium]|nr:UvrD-helicase domain-containing protein [Gemmataceae bacterium]
MPDGNPEVIGLDFFPQQWCAVAAPPGPVLVLAGPGAGKTRCLTGRIGYLLTRHATPASRICAITFTNKAAEEIAARLRHALGDLVEQMTLGTIHALCLKMLRTHGRRVGLPAGFGVASEEHQRLVLSRLGVHTKRHRPLLLLFGRHRLQEYKLTGGDEALFGRYQRELRSNHLIDYDEILALTLALLQSSRAVLAEYQAQWDHLLVDEFQDLDLTQYAILKLLADDHRSLFAVGDDEQSIFSWRGADQRVMARFAGDFNIDRPIVLDVNCRCARAIFAAARKILPAAEPLFAKQITAVRESTFPVTAHGFNTDREETAAVVADLLRELDESGLRRGEFAVLYRTHTIGQQFEEALVAAGVPCQLARGQALADDPIIAQLLASLRVVLHPDADLYVEHLAQKVFPEALLAEVSRLPGRSLLTRVRAYAEQKVGGDSARCWRFLYQVETLKGLRRGASQQNLRDLVNAILDQGIGRYENPLEGTHERLDDPEALPWACALGERLRRVVAAGGRVLLAPAGGLEIPAKLMLQRTLPGLTIAYFDTANQPTGRDAVLDLGPGAPLPPGAADRLKIACLFKALQHLESRQYRRLFADHVTFDTETTGKDIDACEVVELAAVRVSNGRVVDTFRTLVRCNRPIAPGASAIHGYTDADLRGQPTLAEIWPRFREFVGDRVLVVHNGHRFDVPVLQRLTAGLGGLEGLVFFDTLTLARNLFPDGSLRLEDLAVRFGVDAGRSHHALDDSLCLAGVFERLQAERARRSRQTCLPNLLDCLALGAAIEDRKPVHPEDRALVEAGTWRDLKRHAAVVDAYTEEAERLGNCPPLPELIERMGVPNAWPGARGAAAQERPPESHTRLARLIATGKASDLEGGIRELLDRVALSTSDGAGVNRDRVSLLTFHATKGLEFARLYIVGVEDHQLPGYYALADNRADDIREARRLLYVAMTRAKDRLTLTYCRERNGLPTGGTMFLDEMGLVAQPAASARSAPLARARGR